MSGRWRWIGVSLIVAVVAIATWVVLERTSPEPIRQGVVLRRTTPPPPEAQPSPDPRKLPAVEVEQSTMTTVDAQGRRQWELRAESVIVDGETNTATLTAVQGTYYQAGAPVVSFSAPRGTFHVGTRLVALSGGVKARATSGRSVEAQEVRWVTGTRQVTATGSVVLKQKGLVLRADRLRADFDLRRANLEGNIRVTVEQ